MLKNGFRPSFQNRAVCSALFSVVNYGPESFCPQENNFHYEKHIQDETKKPAAFYTTSFHSHASALVFTDMNAGKKKKQKAIPMPSHSNPAASSYL